MTIVVNTNLITSASQLSNTKAYTINTARGAWTLDSGNTLLSSTHKSEGATVNDGADTSAEAKEFAIYKQGDFYYLYSLKAGKFVVFSNSNQGAPLYDYATIPYTVLTSNNPTYPLIIATFDSRNYANNNDGGGIAINGFTTQDGGNRLAIEEARDLTAEEITAINNALAASPLLNKHKAFTVTANRGTWCANAAGTSLATTTSNASFATDYDKFALMCINDTYYLYNVGTKKFIKGDGSLNADGGDPISVRYSGDVTRPYMFFFPGGNATYTGAVYFNMQNGGGSYSMNTYSTPDDGNKQSVSQADIVYMGEMLSKFEMDPALAAITDGGKYYITTTQGGIKYYVTTNGLLTSNIASSGIFTITKTNGGGFGTGVRIDSGTDRFTNPPLSNNVANLKPGNYAHSTGDRADWERQILYLNDEGKFAIRSCNVASATSSWGDAARTFWTYTVEEPDLTPCYAYDPSYVWELEGPLTVVNVTYKLVESDGTTEVSSTTVQQEGNSDAVSPLPGTGINFNGNFHEKFYYDYTVSGTVGDSDCTITITRTEKSGVVKALSDLSNTKAYNIGCDRGAMIAYNGSMVNTALNNAAANAQPYGKFALLNYEDNYYIFSIDENKFIKNDASVALDLTEVGFSTEDAMVMTAQTAPYFLWHFNADDKYLNTNGNQPLGYVINNYSTPDPGNLYYMVEAGDFDPTAALAELEAYFHPAYYVTYVVKDEAGNTLFTSEPQPTKKGAKITTLLAEFQRPFYTYSEENVEITQQNTTVEFTATWTGPFEISADFATAHWYDMAMRMVEGQQAYYVTSGVKDDDGAYKTQLANTMGLVEDAYQWAFIGNGYDGFKVINKAEGDGKSFGWTDATATNAGIPTIMADSEGHHAWRIVPSTNTFVHAGSFCLNVPGTDLYINQYGGAGGSVKFWNSSNNLGDDGSAFTVFDVPTNFASFVVDEIAPSMDATGYFTFTDAAKAALGYDETKKTECSFAEYKAMKEGLPTAMSDPSNLVLPETGYYILKNRYYETYMGIDPDDANMYGNYASANLPKNIVKLTKTGDATYTISLEGLYAPATVAQSKQVTATASAGTYTVVISSVGFAAFSIDPAVQMSCLHRDGSGKIVGWEAGAAASQWAVEDATSVNISISAAGYATTYLPFPVTFPSTVVVYTATTDGSALNLSEVNTVIPAATPVILEAAEGDYTFDIAADNTDDAIESDLHGTYFTGDAIEGTYILQKQGEKVGFFLVDYTNWQYETKPQVKANRAYLTVPAETPVKAFYFGDTTDAIENLKANLNVNNGEIYNLAGQRISKLQRGVNIVNGKKVIIK